MSTHHLNDSPEGTIPVDQAVELAANWRTYLSTSGQDFVAQSFLIPIINFQNILKYNPEASSVRAYIGLSDPTDPLSAQLLLVPVSEGQDIVYLPKGHRDGDSATLQSNVYDLTTVCPPSCPIPPTSPLAK
jgi:hypothetical protein